MKLQDFTSKKIKKDMVYYKKVALLLVSISAITISAMFLLSSLSAPFIGKQFLTILFAITGLSCGGAGLFNMLPNYLEKKHAYNKHYEWLEQNKDNLKYTDNEFEKIKNAIQSKKQTKNAQFQETIKNELSSNTEISKLNEVKINDTKTKTIEKDEERTK